MSTQLIFANTTNTVDAKATTFGNPGEVPDGQIAIMDATGENTDLTVANGVPDEFIIVQGDVFKSGIIKKEDIKDASTTVFSAPTKQKSVIGFNGTTNDLVFAEEGPAFIGIGRQDLGYFPEPKVHMDVSFKTGNIPYQKAVSMARQIVSNDHSFVSADVLADEATTQLVDTNGATPVAVTLDVTKGSSVVVANLAATDPVNLSAGEFLRIGSPTGLSDPLYEVKDVLAREGSNQDIILKRPFAGETASAVDAGSTATAPAAGDAAGITVTGNDFGTVFSVSISESLDGTEVTTSQTAGLGTGYGPFLKEQVISMRGEHGVTATYTPFKNEAYDFVDDSINYDVVILEVKGDIDENLMVSDRLQYKLAFKAGILATASADLSAYFGV